uniref:Uncharacterized protein n=1 Tax=Cryptococcus bacillisporus CA1280 TaxID=1296109 RepID=A0A0D0UJU8_CRYGA|nr:hypothetical protein I312_02294 [Cryptococcus bacillisporus CA1280]
MVRYLTGVEEVNIKRLESAAHFRLEENDDNVPSPTGFKKIDFGVRFGTVEDKEASITTATGNIASKGIEGIFKPFQHHIAVNSARIGGDRELAYPVTLFKHLEPAFLQMCAVMLCAHSTVVQLGRSLDGFVHVDDKVGSVEASIVHLFNLRKEFNRS